MLDEMATTLDWYAVQTDVQSEAKAARHLRWQGYDTFFPHTAEVVERGRKSHLLRKKPLFTRYIFVGLPKGTRNMYPIIETPGVSQVIYAPGGIPFPIPPTAMQIIWDDCDQLGLYMRGGKPKPAFPGKIGDWVKLADTTPYFGFMAEVCSVDLSGKLHVLLETFGRAVRTIIDVSDVDEVFARAAA
jgi:transcriptional antiterminator RfaH